ncbi:hypothetical protein [Formosa sp. PL04]|uniref:hypothetical protein n=1 Tax=Formosa sp. PL04 TaxID=3081755 RepID=UPI00298152D5|nr:hypothetical protein [Formosa sp. PL04]MDW5290804.1 hypothetical protein [Formosa sp. PL04]
MRAHRELVQVILDGNAQAVIGVFSSRAYGWIDKCVPLRPSEIDEVVESLQLPESDSAAITYHTLKAVLGDIDEHKEYSEAWGDAEGIKERIEELSKAIELSNGYEWVYLYKLAGIVEDGNEAFISSARKKTTDPQQLAFLKTFEDAKRSQKPEIILNTKDFSFMSPLLDEAITQELGIDLRYGASNFSTPEERMEAEKSFDAFEYYVSNRPFPICFGTHLINYAIQMAARWENKAFADRVLPFISKIMPSFKTYTSLSRFYVTYPNREKHIENLKLATEYGANDDDFGWVSWDDNPWKDDEESIKYQPKSIFDYPLDED